MKNSIFCCAIFLCCTFNACQKKSLQPNQNTSGITNSKKSACKKTGNPAISEKSARFPDFDLTHPVHSEGIDVIVTTYFDVNYVNGSKDYWTKHTFEFDGKSIQLVYHFVNTNGVTNSDVYDIDGTYEFTYIDDGDGISIEYNNTENPQQMPTGFYDCMKWYINNYFYESIVYGTPYYTYFAYKCYQSRAR